MMRRSKKFTIIELLVVIAIISILSAMLLPTLNSAKKNANVVVNVNKLKNIASSIIIYIDNNNSYPTILDLEDSYLPRSELLDSNDQLFVIEEGITINSGISDAVIIDTSIPGFTNTLYADGHVTSIKN